MLTANRGSPNSVSSSTCVRYNNLVAVRVLVARGKRDNIITIRNCLYTPLNY
nr:MAG TPA: hypothetical protein [Caudoviricetes sp.]